MNGFYPEGWNDESKKRNYSLSELEEARLSGEVLEAPVLMCDANHNLLVNLGVFKGIIPRDEGAIGIVDGTTRDIALISRVGKTVCFVVEEIKKDENGKIYAMLSRKKAQKKCKAYILEEKSVGDIINAKITHLESFGAFCDIGCGNIALLPIDSISISRISHPKDRFFVGEKIKTVIKFIANDGKITLSHKELLGTWEENAELFNAGQTVTGVIRSVESYGVFVEITPNLAGLAEPKEGVKVGEQASVYIKSIIKEKMKIKLIIIDSFSASYTPKINYFYEGDRIENWDYSPQICEKHIYSSFSSDAS